MTLPFLKSTALAGILAVSAGSVSSAPVATISGASYSFRESPLNSMGVKSLSDLRGKPIVIDFWGKN